MYRPQYFSATPKGFKDTPYVRPVVIGQDVTNTVPAGGYLRNYIVQLDTDAPQFFRSLFIEGLQQNQTPQLQIQIRNADGQFLTDGFVPIWLFATGAGSTPPDGGSGRAKVFEPEIYCPPGSVLILDFYNPGTTATGLPTFKAPVLMPPGGSPSVQMEIQAVGGQGQAAGVISYNGALYQVLQTHSLLPLAASVFVYQSIDNGATWHALDSANGPLGSVHGDTSGGVYFDGNHTITVATSQGSAITPVAHPILLQDFNLATGTWGAEYGLGTSGNVFEVNQLYKRSDGSILVIAWSAHSPDVLTAYVFLGGVWTTFSLATLLPGGWSSNGVSSTVYDPATGTIHMFGIAFNPAKKQYYQQILINNTIAGFQDLTGLYSQATAQGNPLIIGNSLVWGVMDPAITFATIVVGTPLTAPVFSLLSSPGIDPTQPIPSPGTNTLTPTLATDGNLLWAVWVDDNSSPNLVYLAYTSVSNLAGPWVGGVIYTDNATVFGNDVQYPTISIIAGLPYITVQGQPSPTNYFMLPLLAGAQCPGYMEFRGVKRTRENCSEL